MFEHHKTKLKIVTNIVVLVIACALYFGLWFGTVHFINSIKMIQDSLAQKDAGEEKIEAVNELFSDRALEIEKINGYFLSQDDVVSFIENIEQLARQTGVESKTGTVSERLYHGIDPEKWGAVSISISTEGSWEQTYQFLSLLEHLPFRSELAQVSLEVSSSETEERFWRGDFLLNVLKKKENESAI